MDAGCFAVDHRLTIMLQGAGLGLAFTSLQILAFAILDSSLRTEGASLLALLRNIGAAIGVSVTSTVLARNTQALHEMIGASATPFNRALQAIEAFNPATHHGAAMLDRIVSRQARNYRLCEQLCVADLHAPAGPAATAADALAEQT